MLKWIAKAGVMGVLLASGVCGVAEDWSQPILMEHKQIGVILRNAYSYVGFMNPDGHSGNFLAGDFKVLPRVTDRGVKTLDEDEALNRFYSCLNCRVTTTGNYPKPVKAAGEWKFSHAGSGVTGEAVFGTEKQLTAKLAAELVPDKAQMNVSAEFVNQGSEALTVTYFPQFAMLIQELQPLKVVVPQKIVRFQMNGKLEFWRTDVTELNANYKTYWWRKVAAADKHLEGRNLQLEKITFDQPKIVSPAFFGLFELRGNNAMVWDLGDGSTLAELELRWQKDLVRVMPVWKIEVPAGETKKVSFRMLPLKNMVRVDAVKDDWLFGYRTRGDMLRVQFLPLVPHERLVVNMSLSNAKGDTLTGKPSEAPKMGPGMPGKLDYRISIPLQENGRYPIKLVLSDLQDNSPVVELDGLVTP